MVRVKIKLHNPFALFAQGFVAGVIIIHAATVLEPPAQRPASQSSSTSTGPR